MAQYKFGVGQLFMVPSGANATPINVGTLKDVSLDISRDIKELYGANTFPEDVAAGKGKITGKAKSGRIQSGLIAAVLAGATVSTGQTASAINEIAPIPGTPYAITAVHSATWVDDGGVYDYTANIWLTKVAPGTPASGQYCVTAGVYTFAAADTTHSIGLWYTYTLTTGVKVAMSNPLMGAATVFQLVLGGPYRSKDSGYKLYAVVFPKMSLGSKQDDFTEVDLDFQAFADSTGRVIDVYTAE